MTNPTNELISLSDSAQQIALGDEDIRGRMVKDASGEDLGTVDDLLIDAAERRVRFLVVASGGFLGIGEDKSYLPVDAIVSVADEIRIDRDRDAVAGAPAYNPELVNEQEYNERTFDYYGFMPFWTAGYAYPAYPYYR